MGTHITIEGRSIPLRFRTSPRSRRLSLRLDSTGDGLIVVAPPHVPESVLHDFVLGKGEWVALQLRTLPQRVPFADGAVIPILGVPHTVRHLPEARRGVWAEEGVLGVSGEAAHVARRLTDWLRQRARDHLVERVRVYANRLGVSPTGVTLRDTRTRWGSCAACGRLSFSWRLILAPPAVVDYVSAHEVAHLVEFNHSPRFWSLVADLVGECDAARHWLKVEGLTLHRYG
ncbi:M48 family metallopeptidase [Pararhodospirillum oryzae]|nr:SprT family zinc-dependent metalloprotease [Pararhodospirillum oryzae]